MELEINSIEDLHRVAETFLAATSDNRIFAFYGVMGAGKTSFIKALCEVMGVSDVVTSPTFAIVNEYVAPRYGSIYHFDFYRINKIEEAYDLGYEEYFYSGQYCFIEWPEKIESLLPENSLPVSIEVLPNGKRVIRF